MSLKTLDPLNDGKSSIELVRIGGSDVDIVNAARVSMGKRVTSISDRDIKLIHFLLKNNHTSPFEHTQIVFRIKTPIYIQRQWMRQRIGVSYNEISGRYTQLSRDYYVPKHWRIQDPENKQGSVVALRDTDEEHRKAYIKSIEASLDTYTALLEGGVCRELARGVQPLCLYTEFFFTCNLVSLFHFVELRASEHAQWEIQQYAHGLINLARDYFPVSVDYWAELHGLELKKGTLKSGETRSSKEASL